MAYQVRQNMDVRGCSSRSRHQFIVSGPGIAAPLTALIKPPLMYPSHMIEELVQAGAIAMHSVIVVITRESEAMDTCRTQARTKLCAMYPRLSFSLSVFI